MKCPYCTGHRNKVIDSRLNKGSGSIRRRRECLDCRRRFTTYERVEEFSLLVVKKDGRREPFDRNKIVSGMLKACEKRPISVNVIEDFVSEETAIMVTTLLLVALSMTSRTSPLISK